MREENTWEFVNTREDNVERVLIMYFAVYF